MLTKAQARALIKAQLPDSSSQVWTQGILDVMIQTVLDEMAGEILDEAPWYVSILQTLATASITSPGYVDLTSAGPLTKRFYRVQSLVRNTQEYSVSTPHDSVVFGNAAISSVMYSYFTRGSQLWAFPLDVNCSIELRYSFLPTAFTSLSESTNVDWPDGFENAYVNEVLARVVSEADRSAKFHAISQIAFDRLKSRVRREYVGPAVMNGSNDSFEWGGT